jgi:hypothetical protein
VHHAGPNVDSCEARSPDPRLVDRIPTGVAERIRLADPLPVEVQPRLYTTTADERFIVEWRGCIPAALVCSGHRLGFAPAIGARLAALAIEAL